MEKESNFKFGRCDVIIFPFLTFVSVTNMLFRLERFTFGSCLSVFRDTAGQERFRTITTAYYRGAMVSAYFIPHVFTVGLSSMLTMLVAMIFVYTGHYVGV